MLARMFLVVSAASPETIIFGYMYNSAKGAAKTIPSRENPAIRAAERRDIVFESDDINRFLVIWYTEIML
jgi:hypothetical protein